MPDGARPEEADAADEVLSSDAGDACDEKPGRQPSQPSQPGALKRLTQTFSSKMGGLRKPGAEAPQQAPRDKQGLRVATPERDGLSTFYTTMKLPQGSCDQTPVADPHKTFAPLLYDTDAPVPLPPVDDPAPWEEWERTRASREGDGPSPKKWLRRAQEAAAFRLDRPPEVPTAALDSTFASLYPSRPSSRLLAHYRCKVLSSGQPIACHLFVATDMLGLCNVDDPDGFRVVVEWHTVLSIQKAVVLLTTNPYYPYVIPLPHDDVVPDCLQLFLFGGVLVQMFEFSQWKGWAPSAVSDRVDLYNRVFRSIDKAWRNGLQLPTDFDG